MKNIAEQIRSRIIEVKPLLLKITPEEAEQKLNPESWAKKEIIGHLIDSALNNHQRIVRGAQNAAMDFPPYNQNKWIEVQRYIDRDWKELIELFSLNNFHLCYAIETLPEDAENNHVNIGKEQPVTLEFIISDYLRHLNHHLNKILE